MTINLNVNEQELRDAADFIAKLPPGKHDITLKVFHVAMVSELTANFPVNTCVDRIMNLLRDKPGSSMIDAHKMAGDIWQIISEEAIR